MAKDNVSEVFDLFCKLVAACAQAGGDSQATVTFEPGALNAEDAARYIGVGRSTFFEIVKDPTVIKHTIVDGQKKYRRKYLDQYLDRCDRES